MFSYDLFVCCYFCGVFPVCFYVCFICVAFFLRVLSVFPYFFHVSSVSIRLDKLKLKVQRHFTSTKCSHKVLIKSLFRCQEVWVFKNEHVPNEFAWDKNKWFRHFIEKSSSVFHFINHLFIKWLEKHPWCNLGGTTDLTQRSVREA